MNELLVANVTMDNNKKNPTKNVLVAKIQSSIMTFNGYAIFISDIFHLCIIAIILNRFEASFQSKYGKKKKKEEVGENLTPEKLTQPENIISQS